MTTVCRSCRVRRGHSPASRTKREADLRLAGLRSAGLYCIIDRELIGRRSPIAVAEAMIAGGARLIQYRDKVSEPGDVYRACKRLRPMLRKADVLFVVNDYPDIAVAVGADGVHVGVNDLPVSACRRVVGEEMLIGRSSHSLDEALKGAAQPIDYLAVGAIFATMTKPEYAVVGLDLLAEVRKSVELPLIAIGGITLRNLDEVFARGADGVAIVSDILNASDITHHVRSLMRHIKRRRRCTTE
ncbi:MAG: thiamine phosphate synthase [Verrucomicrobia bacterium]|nr:thiamine phosphate synthase [Verrucomicrobiota bacterium]